MAIMVSEDLQNVFEKVGLKPAEIQVYLACLKDPEGLFIHQIVTETKIKRGNVNNTIERLLVKKFLSYHIDGARKVFTAEPLQTILFNFQETMDDLKSLIPLLTLSQFGGRPSRVRFFEGEDALRQVLRDILLTLSFKNGIEKEYLSISSATDILQLGEKDEARFIRQRVREGIPVRWIAPASNKKLIRSYVERAQEELRQVKFFDDRNNPFHIDMSIYADCVAFVHPEKGKPSAVIIENELLARSMRSLFNLLWLSLK